MAELNVMKVVFFLLRMAPAIIFVLFMMILFFSFRVDIKANSMERFVFELSDSVTSDPSFVSEKSIFDPEKLFAAERKEIELYARNCDFGYQLDIESAAGRTSCSSGGDCRNFCKSVCNLDEPLDMATIGTVNGNCGCNIELARPNFCQCRKPQGEWQNDYKWSYGYVPNAIAKTASQFPVGLGAGETVLPAKMTITAYDSLLTRFTCASAKAYLLKEKISVRFDLKQIPFSATKFKRTDPAGTHVCFYSGNDPVGGECRYLPDVPIEELDILRPALASESSARKLTAYPLSRKVTCGEIKSNPSAIAGTGEEVRSVVLCVE